MASKRAMSSCKFSLYRSNMVFNSNKAALKDANKSEICLGVLALLMVQNSKKTGHGARLALISLMHRLN